MTTDTLGYRDKYTYKKLGVLDSLRLINIIFKIEDLIENRENENLHQYVYELMQGQHGLKKGVKE